MNISGFTIVRNIKRYHYPVLESIRSILPLCDEFVVNVGDSDDGTLDLIRSLDDPKIRIIETVWDMSEGKTVLSRQTNIALAECRGDWAFYLQSDEVIHEADLPRLRALMDKYLSNPDVDVLRLRWLHFFGSYWRYRVDSGWYQKQDRIIRNNGTVESFGDAYAFRRKDGAPLRRAMTPAYVYHYGWVHSPAVMSERRRNARTIGYGTMDNTDEAAYDYGDLNRFPAYFGSHPAVMQERVAGHALSREDRADIVRRYWWHPLRAFGVRYKTWRRVRHKII